MCEGIKLEFWRHVFFSLDTLGLGEEGRNIEDWRPISRLGICEGVSVLEDWCHELFSLDRLGIGEVGKFEVEPRVFLNLDRLGLDGFLYAPFARCNDFDVFFKHVFHLLDEALVFSVDSLCLLLT